MEVELYNGKTPDKALGVIAERLQEDDTLSSHTDMTIPQIVELLDFYLNMTYPVFHIKRGLLPAKTWCSYDITYISPSS